MSLSEATIEGFSVGNRAESRRSRERVGSALEKITRRQESRVLADERGVFLALKKDRGSESFKEAARAYRVALDKHTAFLLKTKGADAAVAFHKREVERAAEAHIVKHAAIAGGAVIGTPVAYLYGKLVVLGGGVKAVASYGAGFVASKVYKNGVHVGRLNIRGIGTVNKDIEATFKEKEAEAAESGLSASEFLSKHSGLIKKRRHSKALRLTGRIATGFMIAGASGYELGVTPQGEIGNLASKLVGLLHYLGVSESTINAIANGDGSYFQFLHKVASGAGYFFHELFGMQAEARGMGGGGFHGGNGGGRMGGGGGFRGGNGGGYRGNFNFNGGARGNWNFGGRNFNGGMRGNNWNFSGRHAQDMMGNRGGWNQHAEQGQRFNTHRSGGLGNGHGTIGNPEGRNLGHGRGTIGTPVGDKHNPFGNPHDCGCQMHHHQPQPHQRNPQPRQHYNGEQVYVRDRITNRTTIVFWNNGGWNTFDQNLQQVPYYGAVPEQNYGNYDTAAPQPEVSAPQQEASAPQGEQWDVTVTQACNNITVGRDSIAVSDAPTSYDAWSKLGGGPLAHNTADIFKPENIRAEADAFAQSEHWSAETKQAFIGEMQKQGELFKANPSGYFDNTPLQSGDKADAMLWRHGPNAHTNAGQIAVEGEGINKGMVFKVDGNTSPTHRFYFTVPEDSSSATTPDSDSGADTPTGTPD